MDDDPIGRIEGAIERLERLGPEAFVRGVVWIVMRPDDELRRLGLELSEADRFKLVAWLMALWRS
jgi:hypothetical protein